MRSGRRRLRTIKKKIETRKGNGPGKIRRYKYDLKIIRILSLIKLHTSASFRSLSKIAAILNLFFYFSCDRPSHTTILLWLKKLGLHKLKKMKETADDWIILLDESIQFGKEQLLLIYGIRESSLDSERALKFQDLTPLFIKAGTGWKAEMISEKILEVQKEIGKIRYAVSDWGSSLKAALRLCGIPLIHDVTHHIALHLKYIYEKNEDFINLSRQMNEMRSRCRQTELAYVCPPNQRSKSRFHNLHMISKWGTGALKILENREFKDRASLEWVSEFSPLILEMNCMMESVGKIFKAVKNGGLTDETKQRSLDALKDLNTENGARFRNAVTEYFDACRKTADGNRLLLRHYRIRLRKI